jgi:hypothetical protein
VSTVFCQVSKKYPIFSVQQFGFPVIFFIIPEHIMNLQLKEFRKCETFFIAFVFAAAFAFCSKNINFRTSHSVKQAQLWKTKDPTFKMNSEFKFNLWI